VNWCCFSQRRTEPECCFKAVYYCAVMFQLITLKVLGLYRSLAEWGLWIVRWRALLWVLFSQRLTKATRRILGDIQNGDLKCASVKSIKMSIWSESCPVLCQAIVACWVCMEMLVLAMLQNSVKCRLMNIEGMYFKAVVLNLGYAKTSDINHNETQEPLEPWTSSDPRTQRRFVPRLNVQE
jgi:hypothetical protein